MGTELIEKVTDSFQRKHRKSLDILDETDLFSAPPQVSVAVTAVPVSGHTFDATKWYRLTLKEGHVLVVDGITPIGEVIDPPRSVVERMQTVSPSLCGSITHVFTLTGKAEILLESE